MAEKYKNLEKEQSKIGWDQLLYGRFGKNWAEEYNEETDTLDGTRWVSMNINKIWKHISKRWESRCELVHAETDEVQQELTEVLNKRLDKRYEELSELPFTERQVYHKSIEEMKELTNRTKRDWLQRTKRIITKGKQRLRANSTRHTQNISTYFRTAVPVQVQQNATCSSRNSTSRQSTKVHTRTKNKDTNIHRENRRNRKLPNVTLQSEYYPP
jgi:hypothetical protein